jgi:hypothetical protein
MALALLDGSTAAVDFTSGASPVSWKCVVSYMSFDLGRRMEDRTTFCTTGGWAQGVPTMKQGAIRLDGFLSTGATYSDPILLFSSTAAVAFVATFHTGCTMTGNMHATGFHAGMRAQGASEMGVSAVTDGAVTSAWVTT